MYSHVPDFIMTPMTWKALKGDKDRYFKKKAKEQ